MGEVHVVYSKIIKVGVVSMCYFIHLKIVEEGKAEYAKKFIKTFSENGIELNGEYPDFTLTNGMCSCDLVKKNAQKISVSDKVFGKILSNKSIKNISVSWTWGEEISDQQSTVRMDVKEFIEKNKQAELQLETWYQLYDLNKYNRRGDSLFN